MPSKLQRTVDLIYSLLLEFDEAGLIHEDTERLVDLCRYINSFLRNPYFGSILDDIEEHLGLGTGVSESELIVYFDQENIPNKIRSFCRDIENKITSSKKHSSL